MKLVKNIATHTCILNIYVEDDTGYNQYIFDVEDLKTAYVYKKTYTCEYLMEQFKIISIYPNLFDQLCDKVIPKISIDQDKKYYNIQWDVDIPFNKEYILLQIPEHTIEGQNNEIISLQRSNKLLIQKTKKMEEDVKRLEENVKRLEENVKLLEEGIKRSNMSVSPSLGVQLNNIYNDHKLIEILFTADTSFKEHYALNYMVGEHILKIDACEKKLNFLRELIRCGYSVTLQNQKYSGINIHVHTIVTSGFPTQRASMYMAFADSLIYNINSEEDFQKFKEITEIILPTADLNQIYPVYGTLIGRLNQFVSCAKPENSKNVRRIVEYLRSIGAR
jgi:hypothetical protein